MPTDEHVLRVAITRWVQEHKIRRTDGTKTRSVKDDEAVESLIDLIRTTALLGELMADPDIQVSKLVAEDRGMREKLLRDAHTGAQLIERMCEATGRTREELATVIETRDNWGALVHSFEYLTMLGVVRDAIRRS